MQVGPILHPQLNHVVPYKLAYGQLYVSDTYTNSNNFLIVHMIPPRMICHGAQVIKDKYV